jgi:hypothetical protein
MSDPASVSLGSAPFRPESPGASCCRSMPILSPARNRIDVGMSGRVALADTPHPRLNERPVLGAASSPANGEDGREADLTKVPNQLPLL